MTAESKTGIPEELRPYAKEAAEFLRGRLGATGPAWTRPFTAGMSPYETQGLGGLAADYGSVMGSGLTPAAIDQWKRTVEGAYLPGANPYLEQIEAGMTDKYNRELGALQSKIAGAGQGVGTPLARLSADALTGYTSNLGGLRFGAYEQERGRQQAATQGAAAYGPSMGMALMQAGALPRSLEQSEIDRAYSEMQRLWNESYRAAGQASPLFGTSQGTSTQYGASPFGSLMSGLFSMWAGKGLGA